MTDGVWVVRNTEHTSEFYLFTSEDIAKGQAEYFRKQYGERWVVDWKRVDKGSWT